MSEENTTQNPSQDQVTINEVNRVLEVGRLLLSVLTPEEIEELQALLIGETFTELEIGNIDVT
jgi:hypothetical protein